MKPILTCRVTQIEAFRFWMENGNEDNESYINEANVIASIKGIGSSNIKASYGSAGHTIIEHPLRNCDGSGGYKVGIFTFNKEQAAPLLKFVIEHPLMVREIALSKVYSTPHFDLIITGSCDHLEGITIRDTKFKFSSFEMGDFMGSIQWKLYLDMLDLDIFYYDFFRVFGFDSIEDCGKARIGECESLMMKRHEGMNLDIQSTLNEFADFVLFKDLTGVLEITPAKYQRIIAGNYKLKSVLNHAG